MKGFLQGVFWALLLGGAGLGFTSLLNEEPILAEGPDAPQMSAPALTFDAPAASVAVTLTEEVAPLVLSDAPRVTVVEGANIAPDIGTTPIAPPLVAGVGSALAAPAEAGVGNMASTVDGDITVPVTRVVPEVPDTLEVVVAETIPPQVAVVEAETDIIVITNPPSAEAAEATRQPEIDPPLIVIYDAPAPQTEALIISGEDRPAEAPLVEAESADVVVVEVTVDTPESPTEPLAVTVLPEADQAVEDGPAVVAQAPEEDASADTEEVLRVEQNEAAQETQQPSTEVRVNRLVTDAAEAEAAAAAAAAEAEAEAEAAAAPALIRYAASFENPDALPLMSVALIDDGTTAVENLTTLGFSPTIILDALSDGAEARAQAFRDAGLEVAMQISLPTGAQPSDIEVTFASAFNIIPEAAIYFSDGNGVVQNNRNVALQVMTILAADGRGFVTVQRGLGNAARTAEQEGVVTATIQRDLDGDGEDASAIRRGLDQAAFRTRQTGGNVLLGRMRDVTLAALSEWAAENDGEALRLAPASALLLQQSE